MSRWQNVGLRNQADESRVKSAAFSERMTRAGECVPTRQCEQLGDT